MTREENTLRAKTKNSLKRGKTQATKSWLVQKVARYDQVKLRNKQFEREHSLLFAKEHRCNPE